MGRPAKSVTVATGARSKGVISAREDVEAKLRGSGTPVCPEWLTEAQAEIFERIVRQYADAGILAALDSISLANFAVAVERLRRIEEMVNDDERKLTDRDLMTARRGYEATMWRGCTEFCLSPQARAKIGTLTVAKEKDAEDPLVKALRGGGKK